MRICTLVLAVALIPVAAQAQSWTNIATDPSGDSGGPDATSIDYWYDDVNDEVSFRITTTNLASYSTGPAADFSFQLPNGLDSGDPPGAHWTTPGTPVHKIGYVYADIGGSAPSNYTFTSWGQYIEIASTNVQLCSNCISIVADVPNNHLIYTMAREDIITDTEMGGNSATIVLVANVGHDVGWDDGEGGGGLVGEDVDGEIVARVDGEQGLEAGAFVAEEGFVGDFRGEAVDEGRESEIGIRLVDFAEKGDAGAFIAVEGEGGVGEDEDEAGGGELDGFAVFDVDAGTAGFDVEGVFVFVGGESGVAAVRLEGDEDLGEVGTHRGGEDDEAGGVFPSGEGGGDVAIGGDEGVAVGEDGAGVHLGEGRWFLTGAQSVKLAGFWAGFQCKGRTRRKPQITLIFADF